MHRGVKEFVAWVDGARDTDEVKLNPPAPDAQLSAVEQMLGGPLPADLRLVLTRFNGGKLPVGELMTAGIEPGSIGAEVRVYAESVGKDFLDPELLLPFLKTAEGSLLAFDRSAGPVSDTWPIVDYYPDTGDHRLMHRTFDGWCSRCVEEWTSEDWGADFSVDTYLRAGQRHVNVEPDVATAHATVAHAHRRAGQPKEALAAYLKASRCVPPLHWVDWEALKIAALLFDPLAGLEALTRLASWAPVERWSERETDPGRVAEVAAFIAVRVPDKEPWIKLLLQLEAQGQDTTGVVEAIRVALQNNSPLPAPRAPREESVVPRDADVDVWFQNVRVAYTQGALRDDDLLLDPTLRPLSKVRDFAEVIRIRRDF